LHRTVIGPYRQTALVATPTIPPRRRPLGAAWIAGLAAAMAAVGLATGGGLALALVTLSYAVSTRSLIDGRQRRRALVIIGGLPFPVRGVDPEMSARAITSLRFALKDGGEVVIDDWTWGGRDVVLLAHVLSTLGVELHATRGVVAADVTWGPGGPVATI
jgi:hypothetical protein